MVLKSLVSHTIAMSPRHLHTSIGIPSGPIAFPTFILFIASLTSYSCILRTKPLLLSSNGSSNSIVELSFPPLNNLLKYSFHLFLISSFFTNSWFASSLMHLTWLIFLVFLSRILAIL
ncbi:Putative RING zinc finger domain superfamily protein [Zea mays]|uniref:Putative RING zinc finger domain superfamily protein n=1 Tax=Zea mays TaxID=4577 RepID=A0A1D6PFR2_MAIZE|nr:Putative RING zinc finger domain superfamily protein [Zea mays]AQL08329.1 Putative RING zinc finger domain superfamily protein [Zea mays]